MKKKLFMFVCSCALLTACSNSEKKSGEADAASVEVTDMHNAEISLDYEGTYKGVFPAADCPGIETTLTLNADKTFALHQVYIDQKDGTFDEKGTYTVEGDLLTLQVEGTEISYYYKVEENRLRLLDADKNEVTGELAENYILNKE
ncbi:MAG: copper resistance protein NlpE N-terminal domain-containing protein [Muribaculaceae bacterium]|nr:copper resistance protein NlpE N-terminal domain-containing protein [Muribaculaceae bacterium]